MREFFYEYHLNTFAKSNIRIVTYNKTYIYYKFNYYYTLKYTATL